MRSTASLALLSEPCIVCSMHMQGQQNLHLRYHLWMTSLPPKRGMLPLDVHWHGIWKWAHTWRYSVMFLILCSLRSRIEFTRTGKPATVHTPFAPSWVSHFVAMCFPCVYIHCKQLWFAVTRKPAQQQIYVLGSCWQLAIRGGLMDLYSRLLVEQTSRYGYQYVLEAWLHGE